MATPIDPAATSLQARIRGALEREIVSGARPPGSAIDEKALAEQYGASRTPVREALLLLAAEGLVQIAPRSGIYVRQPSLDELGATLEALAETEAALAGLAACRITAEAARALAALQSDSAALARAGEREAYFVANAQLHAAIHAAAANAVLAEQVRGLRKRLGAYRRRGLVQRARLLASSREHAAVVRAVRAGDADAATQAMRAHISAGGEAWAELVRAWHAADAARREAALSRDARAR